MSTYIGSFVVRSKRYFVLHSDSTDSPMSCAMTSNEFISYYTRQGRAPLWELDKRMARAAEFGSSSVMGPTSFDELVVQNTAGFGDSKVSVAEYKAIVLASRADYDLEPAEL